LIIDTNRRSRALKASAGFYSHKQVLLMSYAAFAKNVGDWNTVYDFPMPTRRKGSFSGTLAVVLHPRRFLQCTDSPPDVYDDIGGNNVAPCRMSPYIALYLR
jgi:hypothetical protein